MLVRSELSISTCFRFSLSCFVSSQLLYKSPPRNKQIRQGITLVNLSLIFYPTPHLDFIFALNVDSPSSRPHLTILSDLKLDLLLNFVLVCTPCPVLSLCPRSVSSLMTSPLVPFSCLLPRGQPLNLATGSGRGVRQVSGKFLRCEAP